MFVLDKSNNIYRSELFFTSTSVGNFSTTLLLPTAKLIIQSSRSVHGDLKVTVDLQSPFVSTMSQPNLIHRNENLVG